MSKFVIYTPSHGDYLSAIASNGSQWEKELEKAHFYRTFEQAQRVAKKIVSDMSKHTEPYAIFIREVKEKHGVWKVKSEIEILPPPDREALFREDPESFGRPQPVKPLGPEIAPVKYVICNPNELDYLAHYEALGNFDRLTWHLDPAEATAFETVEAATMMAEALVLTRSHSLLVCELHRTIDQIWVKEVQEIFPLLDSGVSLN